MKGCTLDNQQIPSDMNIFQHVKWACPVEMIWDKDLVTFLEDVLSK